MLKQAPELVACSRATQRALAGALHRDDVKYYPDLTSEPVGAAWVKDRVPSLNAKLHFGFTGRLVAEKGIATICALSKRENLSDITWHIHGAGAAFPPEYFQPFPRVVYHGPYSNGPQHTDLLQKLDAIVLFSSHNEGMPLSLIEAMSAGLPWIATDRGGTREMAVSEANCMVVDPSPTEDALAAAVRMRVCSMITFRWS